MFLMKYIFYWALFFIQGTNLNLFTTIEAIINIIINMITSSSSLIIQKK